MGARGSRKRKDGAAKDPAAATDPSATAASGATAGGAALGQGIGAANANDSAGAAATRPIGLGERWDVLGVDPHSRCIKDDYALGRKLGEGSYGKVRQGRHLRTGQEVAIKSVLKKNMRRLQTLRREIAIMRAVDQPNIIKMLDVYEEEAFLYIVMERCTGGELFDRIVDAGHFTEADAAHVTRQILQAVLYLHEHNIAHRDLKPENFLFASEDPDAPLKLIDFGLSRFYDDNMVMKTRVGTPYYIAPEVLDKKYDAKCDIWSVGVILYILLSGYPPFYGDNERDIYAMIRHGRFDFPASEWAGVSAQAKDLISRMLHLDPATRIDAKTALQHPWFAAHCSPTSMPPSASPSLPPALSPVAAQSKTSATAQSDANAAQALAAAPALEAAQALDEKEVAAQRQVQTLPGQAAAADASAAATTVDKLATTGASEIAADAGADAAPDAAGALGDDSGTLGDDSSTLGDTSTVDDSADDSEQPKDGVVDAKLLRRLTRFARTSKLKRKALGVIVRYLTRGEIMALHDQFAAIDADQNGVISVGELAAAMRRAGQDLSADEMDKIIAALDTDGDGRINYEEFLTASIDRRLYLRDELLLSAFHYFDLDNTGKISRENLLTRFGNDDPQLVESILRACDGDLDGSISFAEFKHVMRTQTSASPPPPPQS